MQAAVNQGNALSAWFGRIYDKRMRSKTAMLINSEAFPKQIKYEVKDGHMLIWTRRDGIIAIDLMELPEFAAELKELADVYGRTM